MADDTAPVNNHNYCVTVFTNDLNESKHTE